MRHRPNRSRPRVMPWAWHMAMAAYQARDMAQRLALPPRLPPADRPPIRIVIDYGPSSDVIDLTHGGRRSDQMRVTLNGEDRGIGTRTSVGQLVAERLPRMASKRAQHEADRIAEDWI